ncbi:cysteine desulfurase family protein [Paenibacillus sp. 1001270B_150601_E10]|uniref:cysteine desulfurase family protein n=1 Tax=Paenibacillus sp. 1001270B_150601_E10 TaxID=2787079 RepID=UPI0018A0BC41|nr:cysteine desulfurase family protein [Paenibacillus sp. 1001270B_150601_E10]
MEYIYMDHAATTPMRPEVVQAITDAMVQGYGNPSSIHAYGREAKRVIQDARDQVAKALDCSPHEIIFTSGGSESDNTAIFGAAWSAWLRQREQQTQSLKPHVITSSIEHHAVLHACEHLEKQGFEVTYVAPDQEGIVHPDAIEAVIKPHTCLISIMTGNNEIGSLQPIQEIGELAHRHGILMHTDAVQALGMLELKLKSLPVDFASFSAHKINGPKGVGILYARQGVAYEAFIHGGNQERKHRAGTENVPGIVGMAAAVKLAEQEQAQKLEQLNEVKETLWKGLKEAFGDRVVLNGHPTKRLPHILNVSLLDVPTEKMLMNLDMMGVMVSSGSACTSGSLEVSHVLKAMELPDERLRTAIRFSFGLGNTKEQAQEVVKKIETIVTRVRNRH